MKINQIIVESTTSGSVATVAQPMGVQSRSGKKTGSMFKGKTTNKPFYEDQVNEEDVILVPGQGRIKKSGFIKHDPDKAEHEGQTIKNSLRTIMRVAQNLDKELSTRDNFPEWASEKIGTIKSMITSVADYVISAKEMQYDPDAIESTGGVIAAGGVGEGAKVDRMVKYITKSEKKLGHSKKEAENIAWATANKRGMLDNKNKKK